MNVYNAVISMLLAVRPLLAVPSTVKLAFRVQLRAGGV